MRRFLNKALEKVKMSDSCKGSNFESIGTIHYRYMVSDEESLLFVPDSNHCLEYSENSYAVFVSVPPLAKRGSKDSASSPDNEDVFRCALAVPFSNNKDRGISLKKSVPIKISDVKIRALLLQYFDKQAAVTVRVERSGNSLELVGITFPAR